MKQQQIILLIIFSIIVLIANTNAQSLWQTYCAPTNVAPGSETAYSDNLGSALSDLITSAGQGELDGVVSYGSDTEFAQAIFYCRGDDIVTNAECQSCVADAEKQLFACTTRTEAIVWYEECTVRVANRDMIGVAQTSPVYIIWSSDTYVFEETPDVVGQETTLKDAVIAKAAQDTEHGFASDMVDVSSDTSFGIAAQCSVDIITAANGPELCNACLTTLFQVVQEDKSGTLTDTQLLGGLMPSCQIVYGFVPIDQPLPKFTNPTINNSTAPASSSP